MREPEPILQAMTSSRRLAAILAADIKGYSHLMGLDEEGTVARVTRQFQEVANPIVAKHSGRIFKTMGDGFLAIFDSPVNGVLCALAFQKTVAEQNAALPSQQWLQYRIGINLGDVIVASDDIYGDSVNVAARLQSLAASSGVCISGSVYDQIKNKLACKYQSLGEEKLKNIADPVRVFRVLTGSADLPVQSRRWWLPAGAALVVIIAAMSAGWFAWVAAPGGGQIGPGAGNATQPDPRAIANTDSSSKEASGPEQHREMMFQRMKVLLADNRFNWRTVDRLALQSGVTEAAAHEILAEHPQEVVLGKTKEGKLIVRLVEH
jgi:class 3 adenylate cyclase